jgi:hypothetical protein
MVTLMAADAPAALVLLLAALPAVAPAAAAAGWWRCMAVLPFAAVEVPSTADEGLLPSPLSAPMPCSVAAVSAITGRARLAAVAL